MIALRKHVLALCFLLAGVVSAAAQNCGTYPNILTNGTTADANQVMADFNLIRNCANNSLAHNAANSDITSITGLTTPLAPSQGGTPLFVGGTSTGGTNAQVVASTTPNSFGLTQGFAVSFVAGFSNSGATTLNVNSTGVKTVQKMAAGALAALVSGDIVTGTEYYVTWDGTVFELLNPSAGAGTTTVPNGGTGNTTLTAHAVMLGEGTSPTSNVAALTNGQLVVGVTGADPVAFTPFTITAFLTHGTNTYTPATGEFRDWVRCVGAGGGGGGANTGNNQPAGSGGAGGYSEGVVSVTPGVGVTVTTGTGGTAGTSSGAPTDGGTGGDTSFGASVIAKGATGGGASGAGSAGTGGQGSAGTGTVKTSGGDGIAGTTLTNLGKGTTGGASNFGGGSGDTGTVRAGEAAGSGGSGGVNATAAGAGADGACIIMALP